MSPRQVYGYSGEEQTMGGRNSGRATKMLIQAIQAAADEKDAVLVVASTHETARRLQQIAASLARGMGVPVVRETRTEIFLPDGASLHFCPKRRENEALLGHHFDALAFMGREMPQEGGD